MDREEIISNLMGKINNADYDRLSEFYPVNGICPTCSGLGQYTLQFKTLSCDCQIQKLLQRHYFNANIPREYHSLNLEHFQSEDRDKIVPIIERYLEKFDNYSHYGIGLTFRGPVGTGKTFGMTYILKELVKRGEMIYMTTFEDLIHKWVSYSDEQAKHILEKKLKRVKVLGIDEVRTDRRNQSGFLSLGFDSVIRFRTSNLLPTFITTNMDSEQEKDEFPKIFSLLSARNLKVDTKGRDFRMLDVRKDTQALADMGERRPIC